MTNEEIIEIAMQAARSESSRLLGCGIDDLIAFAHAIRNAVLEEAAGICTEHSDSGFMFAAAIREAKTK